MKNLRFISAVAAACALFASQPVLAAELSFDTYGFSCDYSRSGYSAGE